MARSGALIMFCLGIISVALIITCVSGNDWAFNSFNKQPVRVGLWKRCLGPAGQDSCIVLGDNVDSWTQAVRALAVLTCLFAFIGTVISLLLLCAKNLPSRYITWFFLCGGESVTNSLSLHIQKSEACLKSVLGSLCKVVRG